MTYKENPKIINSNIVTCKPQEGNCPIGCNQCYANRAGAYVDGSNVPTVEEVGNRIVRMNDLGDSNIQRELVIETAQKYKHYFFNTSLPVFDFPGPVVFTANREEEKFPLTSQSIGWPKEQTNFDNLMFVRLRVSPTNLACIERAVEIWCNTHHVPVVLTFMAYYSQEPPGTTRNGYKLGEEELALDNPKEFHYVAYQWKKRHINSYFCPTEKFMAYVTRRMKKIGGRLVTRCGTVDSNWCANCRNCETYYLQTKKNLMENKSRPNTRVNDARL